MKFRTRYCSPSRVHCCTGNEYAVNYSPRFTDDGSLILEAGEPINLYLEIQSHAESVDINIILARYQAGEADVLDKIKGFYADITALPDNYAELLNIGIKGKEMFDSLPVDFKEAFDNSFEKFACSVTLEDFDKFLFADLAAESDEAAAEGSAASTPAADNKENDD